MAEAEPQQQRSAELVDFLGPGGPQPPRQKPYVGFDRLELNTILGLFSSFNPMIVGLILSAGAYIFLRNRVIMVPGQVLALMHRIPKPGGLLRAATTLS